MKAQRAAKQADMAQPTRAPGARGGTTLEPIEPSGSSTVPVDDEAFALLQQGTLSPLSSAPHVSKQLPSVGPKDSQTVSQLPRSRRHSAGRIRATNYSGTARRVSTAVPGPLPHVLLEVDRQQQHNTALPLHREVTTSAKRNSIPAAPRGASVSSLLSTIHAGAAPAGTQKAQRLTMRARPATSPTNTNPMGRRAGY